MPINKKTYIAAAILLCCTVYAQEQEKQPTPEDLALKETERLEQSLKLEDWQVFYVDSTLTYNYTHLFEEMQALQKAKVENRDLYIAVQDKWMEKTEAAYRKFFSEAQWKEYLKQGGERVINERQKRRDKATGIKPEKKKRKR